ncbi:hypothetical protein [Phormidium nigroviride]
MKEQGTTNKGGDRTIYLSDRYRIDVVAIAALLEQDLPQNIRNATF